MLHDEERKLLLSLARRTLEAALAGRPRPPVDVPTPALREPRGVFVTLRRGTALRGCIGWVEARRPLAEAIQEMAVAAARDPRFDPVTADELPDLSIEISALTPARSVSSPQDIRVGEHGLVVRREGRSGLLLPQVATDYGWDRETFLRQTCRKAGLPENAWEEAGTEISVFTAEVFGE